MVKGTPHIKSIDWIKIEHFSQKVLSWVGDMLQSIVRQVQFLVLNVMQRSTVIFRQKGRNTSEEDVGDNAS